jgi:hypothetical protein
MYSINSFTVSPFPPGRQASPALAVNCLPAHKAITRNQQIIGDLLGCWRAFGGLQGSFGFAQQGFNRLTSLEALEAVQSPGADLRSFSTDSLGWAPLLIQSNRRSSFTSMVAGSVRGL